MFENPPSVIIAPSHHPRVNEQIPQMLLVDEHTLQVLFITWWTHCHHFHSWDRSGKTRGCGSDKWLHGATQFILTNYPRIKRDEEVKRKCLSYLNNEINVSTSAHVTVAACVGPTHRSCELLAILFGFSLKTSDRCFCRYWTLCKTHTQKHTHTHWQFSVSSENCIFKITIGLTNMFI